MLETNFKEVLRRYLEITGTTPSSFARKAGVEKQTIFNYLDKTKSTQPNKRTLDAIFNAHPEFHKLYNEHTGPGADRVPEANEPKVPYGEMEFEGALVDLKTEIRDLYQKIRQKEILLKLLEMKTDVPGEG